MSEEWRDVVGYEGIYSVSSKGRVRSNPRLSYDGRRLKGRMMKLQNLPAGHLQVQLTKEGKCISYAVHKLVALAFLGPRPTNGWHEVRHLNGDPRDNTVGNLKWGTRFENQQDSLVHGTHAHAAKTHCNRGHAYEGLNLAITKSGSRKCVSCSRARQRARARGGEINPDEADQIYHGLAQERRNHEDRMAYLQRLVDQRVSVNEIMRTLGIAYATIQRHHPGYRVFEPGNTPESAMIREANRKLRELERSGKVQYNRDSGFNTRRMVL